ncbi:MAG: MoaD/ThiS family protein [Actinobacteria bacterium]|nr:MoaD/ThiS family protein [Actinomycetota bacterium]
MEIVVKVATILAGKAVPPLPSTELDLDIADGTDVDALIAELGLPGVLVGSVTVNKRRSSRDHVLEDGDKVAIIPAISGG